MAEIWDLVDKNGNKLGVKWLRKNHDFIPEGMYHPAVEVWVKIGDKLLLEQRHPDKTEGLLYDCPGGAVVSGEEFLDAALRELYEEVGIRADGDDITLLGTHIHGCCYAISYILKLDLLPPLTLQPSEVVGFRLVEASGLENIADEITGGTLRRYIAYKDRIVQSK